MKSIAILFGLLFAAPVFADSCPCGTCSLTVTGVHDVEDVKCPENEVMVGMDGDTLSCGKLTMACAAPDKSQPKKVR